MPRTESNRVPSDVSDADEHSEPVPEATIFDSFHLLIISFGVLIAVCVSNNEKRIIVS